MAGRPAFLSLGFLFCCCPPCSPAAPPDSAQDGPWSRAPPDSAQLLVARHEAGNLSNEENRVPRPRLLLLAATCIETLPGPVLSGLRGRCPEELPVQNQNRNHTRRALTAGCACEFLGGLRVPPNGTACAQMLRGCGGGGAVALAVGLSLLLLALAGGVGCVWRWKHRGRAPLALPGFLRPRRRRGDYSQTLSAGPSGLGAKAAAPGPRAGAADPQDPQGHYENLPARGPGAAHARGLYENAGGGACEEHVYGNQPAGDYYNLHAPGAPAAPQDEDIYILPDAY
ncbi:protein GAPT isoform X2 [Myotis myotis]|nr:protein GAPT isoform X2 [Myotis myotis]